jgi:hypothetical protein
VTTADEIAEAGSSSKFRPSSFTRKTRTAVLKSHSISRVLHVTSLINIRKTTARLECGKLFLIIGASSGGRTAFATEDVLELCHLIGYVLPLAARDEPRRPGQNA